MQNNFIFNDNVRILCQTAWTLLKQEEFEDTKKGNQNQNQNQESESESRIRIRIRIRIRTSKKIRQHNEQRQAQKDKQISTTHINKEKDRVTRIPLKTGGEPRCSTSCTHRWNKHRSNRFSLASYICDIVTLCKLSTLSRKVGRGNQNPSIKSKNDRQHNGQKKKDKRTNNDLQNIHKRLQIE